MTRPLLGAATALAVAASAAAQVAAPAAAPTPAPPPPPTLAQIGMFIYPAQGQAREQQKADEAACTRWAEAQTGLELQAGTVDTKAAAEAAEKQDISVFPLATPLIAGPGAIGATILLIANAQGDTLQIATVIGSMVLVLLLTLLLMLVAGHVQRLLGVTGLQVVSRVVGVLLAALAVQFIFDGIKASGILSGPA